MAAKSNIVYQYFKKESEDHTIFIQYDPIRLSGSKLTVKHNGDMELQESDFESNLPEQLKQEGFELANPLEFHLLINGLR
jgi:hypothetical protein